MFEDIIVQLDELGVPYTEDETLSIDISAIDKSLLIEVIALLQGYTFDINESSITVESNEYVPAEEESYDEDAYLDDAFAQM